MPDAYKEGEGYTWDCVMEKADELLKELIGQKFSGQDIAHIGLRLQLMGNHIWNVESKRYLDEQKR